MNGKKVYWAQALTISKKLTIFVHISIETDESNNLIRDVVMFLKVRGSAFVGPFFLGKKWPNMKGEAPGP